MPSDVWCLFLENYLLALALPVMKTTDKDKLRTHIFKERFASSCFSEQFKLFICIDTSPQKNKLRIKRFADIRYISIGRVFQNGLFGKNTNST